MRQRSEQNGRYCSAGSQMTLRWQVGHLTVGFWVMVSKNIIEIQYYLRSK